MFGGIALACYGLPLEMLEQEDVRRRIYERGGEREVQFLFRDRKPVLPVWHEGQLVLAPWGNRRRESRRLPPTGWTWQKTVDDGSWAELNPAQVDIPASMGLENGVWYQIRQGVQGLLVTDESGTPRVYMICEPASYYYHVMTRSHWMPVLIGERY